MNDQEWEELRKMIENWLQGATSWIVVHVRTTLLYSSRCHRHGGCHRGCHGGCSVDVGIGADCHCVSVVTAASLQGHGCQRSKEKCSLTVPVVTWISFKKQWDAMLDAVWFSARSWMFMHLSTLTTSNTTLVQTTENLLWYYLNIICIKIPVCMCISPFYKIFTFKMLTVSFHLRTKKQWQDEFLTKFQDTKTRKNCMMQTRSGHGLGFLIWSQEVAAAPSVNHQSQWKWESHQFYRQEKSSKSASLHGSSMIYDISAVLQLNRNSYHISSRSQRTSQLVASA